MSFSRLRETETARQLIGSGTRLQDSVANLWGRRSSEEVSGTMGLSYRIVYGLIVGYIAFRLKRLVVRWGYPIIYHHVRLVGYVAFCLKRLVVRRGYHIRLNCRLCSLLPAICLDVCLTISSFCPSRHLLSKFEMYMINSMVPVIINQVLKWILAFLLLQFFPRVLIMWCLCLRAFVFEARLV